MATMGRAWAGLLAVVFAGAGCGGDDKAADRSGGGERADTWYAITTNVPVGEGYIGYLVGTTRLRESTLGLADSIEIGGGTVHSAGDGRLFVAPFETPTFTRYDVDDAGRLSESGRIAFGNLVSEIYLAPRQLQFVSDRKAYVPLADQIIAFDPSGLEILASIPVTIPDRQGIAPSIGNEFFRRGDTLYWTAKWGDVETDVVAPATALVAFDVTTETVKVAIKEGCGAGDWGAEGADGSLYFGTGARATASHELSGGARAGAPCLLRVAPGAEAFADDVVDLKGLAGGKVAALGGLVTPGKATLRLFEPSALAVTGQTTSADMAYANAWSWWYLDLATRALSPLESVDVSGGETYTFTPGDVTLMSVDKTVETTLLDITRAAGAPARSVTVPGSIYSAVRVR